MFGMKAELEMDPLEEDFLCWVVKNRKGVASPAADPSRAGRPGAEREQEVFVFAADQQRRIARFQQVPPGALGREIEQGQEMANRHVRVILD